ncbi:MAG: RNA pseudouridine synthase [Pirellulaceae bacterium]
MENLSAEFGFDLLYERGACLAVIKPAGLLTQAVPGIDCLELRVRKFIAQREEKQGNFYLVPVHRLDRPVSGVVLFCRNVRAAKRLSKQFERRTIRKSYWAMVQGQPAESAATWIDYVRKIPDVAQGEVAEESSPGAKYAELDYQVLEPTESAALLQLELKTGRYHQIRVQAAARGLPIWGDRQYGGTHDFGPEIEHERERHIALHARQIAFRHPMEEIDIELTAPLPATWAALPQWDQIASHANLPPVPAPTDSRTE